MKSCRIALLALLSALWLPACTTATDDGSEAEPGAQDRDHALGELEQKIGAPIKLETGETGAVRVLAFPPGFTAAMRAADPAEAAARFIAEHRSMLGLTASEAASFVATRVDVDPGTGLRHITLQRMYGGIPVFRGAITVHMDNHNGVFRVVGDDSYRPSPPINRMMLTPAEATVAAAKLLGLGDLAPSQISSDAQRSVFTSALTLDPIEVTRQIFQVAAGDSRFAYQATMSWLDDRKQLQYQLVLIDAADGSLLASYSLVNDFTGRVFTRSPGAAPTTDGRTVVSFDGDPVASPSGWVDATRKTIGNNAIAATDLNADNTVGANETQPTADSNNSFDFPFSPLQDAASFRAAAVTSAFYLVNDWHDRTYRLGFTEAAGNFQTSNFGRGGAQNDEVQVDAQDGSGVNNANFATPPDGLKPRMQMFLFNGSPRRDGDFDPTVIYHENTHGLSNRLVGGGATTCLSGTQSGGMGEGWSDFIAASFLDDPVIGAYVTRNATVGIRRASMANSPFTYGDIKNGTMTEVHDAGEIWAATLWDIRRALGAETTNQLVVSGMKLTPCSPTMLQARDAILAADATLNNEAYRCKIFAAFAGRLMGSGASSPNHNSTSTIVTSTTLPVDCRAQHEVFRGTDGHLHELYNDGTRWVNNNDLTAFVQGSTSPASDTFGYSLGRTQHIVFRSADDHLHEFFNNGVTWADRDLTSLKGGPGPAGSPSGYILGKTQHVVFRGTDGHVRELFNDGTDWISNNDLTMLVPGSVPPVGDPFGYVLDKTQHIVYRSADNHLHELFNDGVAWEDRDQTMLKGGAGPAGNPSGYVVGNTQHIVFRGTDGHVHELWNDGTQWVNNNDLTAFISGSALPAGEPFGYALGKTQHIVFRSADNHLHELFNDGATWGDNDLTIFKGGAGPAVDPTGYILGKTQHMMFRGIDGDVHELWNDGTQWVSNNDLTTFLGGIGPGGRVWGYVP